MSVYRGEGVRLKKETSQNLINTCYPGPDETIMGKYARMRPQLRYFHAFDKAHLVMLVEEGLVDQASVVNLLKNDVVLIVPEGVESNVTGFEDLANADVVAIGDPESVPAGKYAQEILTGLGTYDQVAEKASFGNSVTEVLTWVAEGSAGAGIVYSTDALTENSNGDDK